jgi:hypothetical protein
MSRGLLPKQNTREKWFRVKEEKIERNRLAVGRDDIRWRKQKRAFRKSLSGLGKLRTAPFLI